jgi:biopolymer transport protein TolR
MDKVAVDQLAEDIRKHLREQVGERKVYIRADGRARWGRVGEVIDRVRAAGIPEVGFLTDQGKQYKSRSKPFGVRRQAFM